MSSYTYLGELGYNLQPGHKTQTKRNGLLIRNERWKGTHDGTLALIQGQPHPNSSLNLVLMEWTINDIGAEGLAIDLHYEGLATAGTSEAVRVDRVFDGSTTQAAIQTHPRFAEVVQITQPIEQVTEGGKAYIVDYDTGARFDPVSKRFSHFGTYTGKYTEADNPPPEALNRKAGQTSYKMPTGTFTRSFVSNAWPDMSGLGYIASPNDAPPLRAGQTWLLDKIRARSIAQVYFEVQEVFLASGERGWDEDWYSAPA